MGIKIKQVLSGVRLVLEFLVHFNSFVLKLKFSIQTIQEMHSIWHFLNNKKCEWKLRPV